MLPLILTASMLAPADADARARAALALAAATRPVEAKQPNQPPPCEYLPNCPCGCQSGGPCTCGPKDGQKDGEWTYDAATRKWWRYEYQPITPPVLPVLAPAAQPALLPTLFLSGAPSVSFSSPTAPMAFAPSRGAYFGGGCSGGG